MCGLIGVNDAPFPSYLSKFLRNFKVNLSDFFSKLKTKLLKYFPEILGTFLLSYNFSCLIILEPLPESTESTALAWSGYSGAYLWHLKPFEVCRKVVFFAKNRFNSNFQIKILECAPFLSNAHFYQTFRKNFHQNFGVCGLIGSHWRTLTPLFLSKFRIFIKLFAKIFIKILECVAL